MDTVIKKGLERDKKRMGRKTPFQFPSGLEAATFQSGLFREESLADIKIPPEAQHQFPTGKKCFNLAHEGVAALAEELFQFFDPKLIHEFFVGTQPSAFILAFSGSYVSKIIRCIIMNLIALAAPSRYSCNF
jgi:hypothetical protein